ncbi:MAG: adenylate kinase [Chloroflexi bacterium]|nr:adenylate kinase [Chloroflexota bacterium]MCC6891994.1 adenylate kinase [Anaerolineae bacterium]
MTPKRIVIIGNSATGKTTLARQLAVRLNCTHIERDALQWEAGWQKATDEAFRAKVTSAIQGERWVADGNFSRVRDAVWGRADTLIWLDYPLWFILWRLTRRSWQRVRQREILWNGNRETWSHLLARDGVFAWTIKAHFRHRREYPALLREPRFSHLRVIRIKSEQSLQNLIITV